MKRPAPVHAPMDHWPTVEGLLAPGGIPLPRLADRVGQTPFYVYDRELISRRVQELRAVLPDRIELHYAIKANPMQAVVDHLAPRVDGFDVASLGELRRALDAGMVPERISFAGPGKTGAELRAALAAGIVLHVESPRELEAIGALAAETGYRPRVALRVNPDFELKSSGMKMGGGARQFGIDAEQVPGLLRALADRDWEVLGFHIFSGSQNLRPEAIVEAQARSLELGLRLAAEGGIELRHLNIGGGFGIPYFPGEQRLDLAPVSAALEAELARHGEALAGTAVIVELGRYIVGEAGLYVARVLDRKESRGQVFLVTDGGLHHHLAASGNFGQVIRKNYPATIVGPGPGGPTEVASIVGPLCTPLDLLADRMELPVARPGDLAVIFQSGAYGPSASPGDFLSHPPVIETLV